MNDSTTDFGDVLPEDRKDLRDALIDQMEYLVDEIRALKTVVHHVPDDVQGGRPTEQDLSMKELYGVIASLDAGPRRERIERTVAEEMPTFTSIDTAALAEEAGWNDKDIDTVLAAVQDARADFVDVLKALSLQQWKRTAQVDGEEMTVFQLVYHMAKDDMQRMRALGHRLHGANLSQSGDQPLPQ